MFTWLLYLALVVFFLFLVAVFAGAETGFVCLDISVLKNRAKAENGNAERSLLKIARQPDRFLALTLIGINMAIVISTSLLTNLTEPFGPFWVSVETVITSLFIFLFCEVLPKMAFSANPLDLSLKALPIMEISDRLLSLPIIIVTTLTRFVMNVMGLRSERKKRQISRDELMILLGMGAASGTITDRPHRMAKGIIGLKETLICEIMIPRVRMVALEVSSTLDRARKLFIESEFSRIPVYEGGIDQMIGILYFKDLFLRGEGKSSLRELVKPAMFVPEVKNAYELFRELMAKKGQSAIVIDEFGATAGLVSLEDLIEEVVGEIQDEFDEPDSRFKIHGDGTITVRAELSLSELEDELDVKFSDTEGIHTLNGLILSKLGRIPPTGECVTVDGYRLDVTQADMKKVVMVRIAPSQPH